MAPPAIVVILCSLLIPAAAADRKERALGTLEPSWRYSDAGQTGRSLDHDLPGNDRPPLRAATIADTTILGSWTFGVGCTSAGWTGVDRTEQSGTFFHIDDFAGLGGGDYGRLVPLQATQSMWCGLRPGQTHPALCSYTDLPGYGNDWDQNFLTVDCLDVTGDVSIDYLIAWDSENSYDATLLEYEQCDGNWSVFGGGFSGAGSGFFSSVLDSSLHTGDVRLRFRFYSDGVWSDQDGEINTDGAVILDSITVRDDTGVILSSETFEIEAPGATATASGNWIATAHPGYGDFAAVFSGYTVVQEGLCNVNPSCLWGFFAGSTADFSCGGYSGQAVVPYANADGQFAWNEIWSPWVPFTGDGESVELVFDVYRDLPIDALVFYLWHIRSRDGGMCPGAWNDHNFVYFGPEKQWLRQTESVGDLVDPGAVEIQVALGLRDMCQFWCGYYGSGECHTHAPLFDNVELRRIDTTGPQWRVRDLDLFQDTFAADGTTTGTARIDAGIDLLPAQNPGIRPGDSTVVRVSDVEHGLATDPHTGSGPAVYAYVSVWNSGDPYSGAQIEEDGDRWPVVDSLTHGNHTWYCVRMDTANNAAGQVDGAFCVDLNDNLFVPGDTIFFAFAATSAAPGGVTTYWTPFTETTLSLAAALDDPDECTILPAAGWARGGEVLYVDGYNGRGAERFFDTAFAAAGFLDGVDRYDVRGSGSRAGNRPGARVTDVSQQLLPGYRVILWNTGDLRRGLIGDGTGYNEKSDDATMLLEFLEGLTKPGGVYFSGDDIAEEWESLTGNARPLRDNYIAHTLVNANHSNMGISEWPAVIGEPGGPFDHLVAGPDTTYALSLCPDLHDFDVLAPMGAAQVLMRYEGAHGAVIGQQTINPQGQSVGVILSGFSYHVVRDDRIPHADGMDRFHLLRDMMLWFGVTMPAVTGATTPLANHLAQNVPNPFNPVTTIEFTVRERAPVTLRVYNVRGQLVKTLVDDTRAPGVAHRIDWDGRNDAGQRVASGVYFYRLVTKGYTKTRKMVLLK